MKNTSNRKKYYQGKSVKIDDEVYYLVRQLAKSYYRTISGQISLMTNHYIKTSKGNR